MTDIIPLDRVPHPDEPAVPRSTGKSAPQFIKKFNVDILSSFLQAHMTSSVVEVSQAYLEMYRADIDAVDPEAYHCIGFALSNLYEKRNCNFINTISALFALSNCQPAFAENIFQHLAFHGADATFLRASFEASKTGHIILATVLFLLSVRDTVVWQPEFIGVNSEAQILSAHFVETHPILDEISAILISRFDEIHIIDDGRRRKLRKKVSKLKNLPAGDITEQNKLLEKYFQLVYHVVSLETIWFSNYDQLKEVYTEGFTTFSYETAGVVPEPFSIDGFVTNIINRLNEIKYPVTAQPTVPPNDPRFVLSITLCNSLNLRNQGMQIVGFFKNYRMVRSPMEIPVNDGIQFVSVGCFSAGVDHTYSILFNGTKMCVINGRSVALSFEAVKEFGFYDLRLIEPFVNAPVEDKPREVGG
jgi:hypothetical protein